MVRLRETREWLVAICQQGFLIQNPYMTNAIVVFFKYLSNAINFIDMRDAIHVAMEFPFVADETNLMEVIKICKIHETYRPQKRGNWQWVENLINHSIFTC